MWPRSSGANINDGHACSHATQADVSDTLWSMTDLAEMVDTAAPSDGKRGPYKKRIAA
jgi:hypothetical protein